MAEKKTEEKKVSAKKAPAKKATVKKAAVKKADAKSPVAKKKTATKKKADEKPKKTTSKVKKVAAKAAPKVAKVKEEDLKKKVLKVSDAKKAKNPAVLDVADVDPALVLKVKVEFKPFDEIISSRKFSKVALFSEQDEIEERANKKKYTESKMPEFATRAIRSKEHKLEETPEELIARIARELEDERSVASLDSDGVQVCTKCGILPVSDEFRVDRDLGYCELCAELLGLGESKEARKEFPAAEQPASENAAF